MFSIPGVLGLIFLTYVRPQAFVGALQGLPLLHLVYLLAVVGFAVDLRLRIIKPRMAPLVWLAIAYMAWTVLATVIMSRATVIDGVKRLGILFALFFLTAQAVQSFRALRTGVVTLVFISLFLSVVGIDQQLAPRGCFELRTSPVGTFDGRYCEDRMECFKEGDPTARYVCEKIGLFGTYTIEQRVRWLGIIEDPNELAMCVSLCIPLLIGLYLLRPGTLAAISLAVGATALVLCTVFTQSRGGQLVFITALGVYFIRRYKLRGAILVAVLAAPMLLFGGRSGEDAEESKVERLEALWIAAHLIFTKPVLGVGYGQFMDYHIRTAHNSYALTGAEMGLPGLALLIAMLYQSMKSFIVGASRHTAISAGRVAYVWAGSLAAAQCGFMVGIFFLSFNSSPILWTFLGLCGGYQLALLRHDPQAGLRLTGRDWRNIIAITLALSAFMYIYSHTQGAAP